MSTVEALQARQNELRAALAQNVYEPPEAVELRLVEERLKAAARAEEEERQAERSRRAAKLEPELRRAESRTLAALDQFLSAVESERAVRGRVGSEIGTNLHTPPAVPWHFVAPLRQFQKEH
jgi:hypothetical protein